MLEPKDLEMISSLFHQGLQPLVDVTNSVSKKVGRLETEVADLKSDVTQLKSDVSDLKSNVAQLNTDVSQLKFDVSDLKSNVFQLNTDVAQLKSDVAAMQYQFSDLNQKVLDIQLTLENETNRNIRIIAEGHLDLSRKFNEAAKISEEDEMMKLRVTTLENEVRKIKTHLEIA